MFRNQRTAYDYDKQLQDLNERLKQQINNNNAIYQARKMAAVGENLTGSQPVEVETPAEKRMNQTVQRDLFRKNLMTVLDKSDIGEVTKELTNPADIARFNELFNLISKATKEIGTPTPDQLLKIYAEIKDLQGNPSLTTDLLGTKTQKQKKITIISKQFENLKNNIYIAKNIISNAKPDGGVYPAGFREFIERLFIITYIIANGFDVSVLSNFTNFTNDELEKLESITESIPTHTKFINSIQDFVNLSTFKLKPGSNFRYVFNNIVKGIYFTNIQLDNLAILFNLDMNNIMAEFAKINLSNNADIKDYVDSEDFLSDKLDISPESAVDIAQEQVQEATAAVNSGTATQELADAADAELTAAQQIAADELAKTQKYKTELSAIQTDIDTALQQPHAALQPEYYIAELIQRLYYILINRNVRGKATNAIMSDVIKQIRDEQKFGDLYNSLSPVLRKSVNKPGKKRDALLQTVEDLTTEAVAYFNSLIGAAAPTNPGIEQGAPAAAPAIVPEQQPTTGSGIRSKRMQMIRGGMMTAHQPIRAAPILKGIVTHDIDIALIPFGKYFINQRTLLKNRRLTLLKPSGQTLEGYPTVQLSEPMFALIESIVKDGQPDYRHINKLNNDERQKLARIFTKSNIKVDMDFIDNDGERFELLKKHIMAGGNNKDELREFADLLRKFVKLGRVKAVEAMDIIAELSTL